MDDGRRWKRARGNGLLTRALHPLSPVSSLVFFVAMLAYPLVLAVRNYGVASSLPGLPPTNAALQLDLTWMHVASDVIACMYGAWCSYKACSARCAVNPPWSGGNPVRRYGVPMAKGAVISALSYALACLPAVVKTIHDGSGPFPLGSLLVGMSALAMMFVFGFALGVVWGSRWSLVPAAIVPMVLIWVGVMAVRPSFPSGRIFPRLWGSSWGAILPVVDTGIGSEPGLRVNPQAVALRMAVMLLVAFVSVAACAMCSLPWRHASVRVVSCLTVLFLIPAASGGVAALVGPAQWERSAPFTPRCESIGESGMTVCSHPDDSAKLGRYVRYMQSMASWFPPGWVHEHQGMDGIVILLGNSFTPTTSDAQWNLTRRGSEILDGLGGKPIEILTDTITTRTGRYSDLLDISSYVTKAWIPADCAASAAGAVDSQKSLDDPAALTAFVLDQVPYRMRNIAYAKSLGSLPGGAQDKAASVLNDADDETFRIFVRSNMQALDQCAMTPQQVLDDAALKGR